MAFYFVKAHIKEALSIHLMIEVHEHDKNLHICLFFVCIEVSSFYASFSCWSLRFFFSISFNIDARKFQRLFKNITFDSHCSVYCL